MDVRLGFPGQTEIVAIEGHDFPLCVSLPYEPGMKVYFAKIIGCSTEYVLDRDFLPFAHVRALITRRCAT